MKHGHVSSFTVSYDELARRLESVGETLLYAHQDTSRSRDQPQKPDAAEPAMPARKMDPRERERLGHRLLEQARKMRADATRPKPDRAEQMRR